MLDLGPQPAADHFPPAAEALPEPRAPLVAVMCASCHLVQLLGQPPPFPEQPPLAVESASSRRHAEVSAREVVAACGLGPGANVVEFASHHGGSWLHSLHELGVTPLDGPFGSDLAADLVVDVHAIAHEEDLDAALAVRTPLLGPGGFLVFEFHHLLPLVQHGQFDTVRHGHPLYLSILSMQAALARHGLVVVEAQRTAVYGGSLRLVARRVGVGRVGESVEALVGAERAAGLNDPEHVGRLQHRAANTAAALRHYLVQARAEGRRVLGYGAPSKAAVLLTWSGVGLDLLPFTVDLSPAKHGRRIPGCGIPIRAPKALLDAQPDDVMILTWDIAAEVATEMAAVRDWGGRFVLPVPEPHEWR